MGRALSEDLRKRAVEAWENGQGSQPEVAKLFGIGEASLRRWVRLKRETGSLAPSKAPRGKPSAVTAEVIEMMLAHLRKQPDATRAEVADAVVAAGGPRFSVATIGRALQKAGWSRKKSPPRDGEGPSAHPGPSRRLPELGSRYRAESMGLHR